MKSQQSPCTAFSVESRRSINSVARAATRRSLSSARRSGKVSLPRIDDGSGRDREAEARCVDGAHEGLERTPTVTKASDVNTLVSAAQKALQLAERLSAKRGDNTSREQVVAEMERILDMAEGRRRRDAVDALRALGSPKSRCSSWGCEQDGVNVEAAHKPARAASIMVTGDETFEVDPVEEVVQDAPARRRLWLELTIENGFDTSTSYHGTL